MSAPTIQNQPRLLDQLRAMRSEEDRIVRVTELDPAGDLLVELADEAAARTATDPEQAEAVTDMVRSLADHFRHGLAQVRSRRAHARALSYGGRFEGALGACEAAVTIATEHDLPAEGARARLASMHALGELGRFDEAIVAGQAAHGIFTALGEPALAARAEINLGITFQRQDQPATAVEYFRRARAALPDDSPVIGQLENGRGEALLALNDFRGAEDAFANALQAFQRQQAGLTAAIAEGNLADVAARQGHLHQALFHYERARRRFEADKVAPHLARLLAEQAEAKAILGLPGEALAEYEANLPKLDACGLALEAARARAGMGRVLLRLGRGAEAETALAAAAAAFEELGHTTARATVDLARAELLMINGRLDAAHAILYRAMSVLGRRPADSIAARYLLARLAFESGDLELAISELSAAIAQARALDLPPLLVDLLHRRGRLYRRLGRIKEASADLIGAVASIERTRGTLQADRLRAAYLGDRAPIYEDLISVLLQRDAQGSLPDAFDIVEQAKSRALLDQIAGVVSFDPVPLSSDDTTALHLHQRLGEIQSELNGYYSTLAEGDCSSVAESEVRRSIHGLEGELDAITGRLSVTSGTAGLMAPTASLEQVSRSLPAGAALIEYMTIGQELICFAITRHGASVHRDVADMAEVTHHLARLRFQIDRALRPGAAESPRFDRMVADTQRELFALRQRLLGKVEDLLEDVEQVTVVPHGPLHLVPFPALWDGQRYLLETHCVHTAPSASIFCQLAGKAPAASDERRALVVGVPDAVAPRIAEEAHAVATALGRSSTRLLIGEAATVETVHAAVRGARIIHFACHGCFDAHSPLSCGLQLGDRWMTVRDIYSMPLSADLVTLSGCETGVNSVTAGDELIGLLRGFFGAGARTLLATLWRAHDEHTAAFMCRLYDRWAQAPEDEPMAQILRRVQLEQLDRSPHPAFWAPFTLVGRP